MRMRHHGYLILIAWRPCAQLGDAQIVPASSVTRLGVMNVLPSRRVQSASSPNLAVKDSSDPHIVFNPRATSPASRVGTPFRAGTPSLAGSPTRTAPLSRAGTPSRAGPPARAGTPSRAGPPSRMAQSMSSLEQPRPSFVTAVAQGAWREQQKRSALVRLNST